MSYKKDVKALREKSRYAFVCQKGKCWGVGDTPGEAYTHARTRVTDFLRKQAGDSSDDTAVLGGWLDLIGKWHPFIARITPEWCEEWKAKLDRLQNVMEIRVDPHRLTTRHSCSVKMLMHDDEMEFKRKCRDVVGEATSVESYQTKIIKLAKTYVFSVRNALVAADTVKRVLDENPRDEDKVQECAVYALKCEDVALDAYTNLRKVLDEPMDVMREAMIHIRRIKEAHELLDPIIKEGESNE